MEYLVIIAGILGLISTAVGTLLAVQSFRYKKALDLRIQKREDSTIAFQEQKELYNMLKSEFDRDRTIRKELETEISVLRNRAIHNSSELEFVKITQESIIISQIQARSEILRAVGQKQNDEALNRSSFDRQPEGGSRII